MGLETSLYDGVQVYLSAFDLEVDSVILSGWSYDPRQAYYLNSTGKAMSPADVRQMLEKQYRDTETSEKGFYFAIRLVNTGALIGTFSVQRIAWSHAVGQAVILMADEQAPTQAYEEALELGLNYIFRELNLHRISVRVPEFDRSLITLLEQNGFTREVCQREADFLHNRHWDLYYYGLLEQEWQKGRTQ